jgi:hypothetical protein
MHTIGPRAGKVRIRVSSGVVVARLEAHQRFSDEGILKRGGASSRELADAPDNWRNRSRCHVTVSAPFPLAKTPLAL